MKTFSGVGVLVLVMAGSAAAYERQGGSPDAAMRAVVSSYLEIHAQLTKDKIDGVPAAAAKLAADASRLPSGGDAIVKAAKSLQQATDLKSARDGFTPVSDAVIAAAKAQGWKGLDEVKLGYCPMLKRSWLQKDKDLRNPYGMLTCGVFQDKS